MRALSVRQPWAWLIIYGGKDVENRTWPTQLRGRFLVHASKGLSRQEYLDAIDFIVDSGMPTLPNDFPAFEHLERGGIIGSVEIVDCVQSSDSPWFTGPHGFLLRKPRELRFRPLKGRLGFFNPETPMGGQI